jgi:Fic family protein
VKEDENRFEKTNMIFVDQTYGIENGDGVAHLNVWRHHEHEQSGKEGRHQYNEIVVESAKQIAGKKVLINTSI